MTKCHTKGLFRVWSGNQVYQPQSWVYQMSVSPENRSDPGERGAVTRAGGRIYLQSDDLPEERTWLPAWFLWLPCPSPTFRQSTFFIRNTG